MMREPDQSAMDRAHPFGDEFLGGPASGALARVPALSSETKLIADAMAAFARLEHDQMSVDQIFRADAGRSFAHDALPKETGEHGSISLRLA